MKKKLNKFIATLTVCAMSLSCINVYATQDNTQTIKGTFTFGAHSSDVDLTDSYEYSDSYFEKSGYEENTNLAIMSMRMAAASISSSDVDYSEKSKNIQNLLEQIGFNEVEANEYYKQKMDFNTMGAAVAYKVIGDSVVLALVPRSAGYENEWAGNFVVGKDGKYHKGFDTTSDIVLNFAKEYVANHKEVFNNKTVKIWTMGYSRGAATANLIGAKLIDNPEYLGIKVTADDIYDYAFGTPASTVDENARDEKYNCIYNYISDYDPVSMVPFKAWGFTRYGVDKQLDVHNTSIREKFLSYLMNTNKNVYDIYTAAGSVENPDNFEAKTLSENLEIIKNLNATLSQKEFLEERIDYLAKKYVSDRETYSEKYETAISTMAGLYLGADSKVVDALYNGIINSEDKYKAVITLFFADYIEWYCNKMGLDNKVPAVVEGDVLPDPETVTGNEEIDAFLQSDNYKAFYAMVSEQIQNGYLDGSKTYGDILNEYKMYTAESVKSVIEDGFSALQNAGYEEEYNKYHVIAEGNNPEALAELIGGLAFGINYSDDMTISDVLIKKINQVCTLAGNNAYMRVHNNEIILSWLRAMYEIKADTVKDSDKEEINKQETITKDITNKEAPKTGDNSNIVMYISLMLLTTMITIRRRKKA